MIDIPLIKNNTGKVIYNSYYPMPNSAYYGMLQLKYDDIIKRIYFLNKTISEIFIDHNQFVEAVASQDYNFERLNNNFYSELRFKTEGLVYWLRKTSDELIGLQYYLEYIDINNAEPDSIKIESIGTLLNTTCQLSNIHSDSKSFLIKLNEVSNTYKHSFVDYTSNFLFGRYEPTLNAVKMKWNKSGNHPELFELNLKDILIGFNRFFNDSLNYISKLNDSFLNKPNSE